MATRRFASGSTARHAPMPTASSHTSAPSSSPMDRPAGRDTLPPSTVSKPKLTSRRRRHRPPQALDTLQRKRARGGLWIVHPSRSALLVPFTRRQSPPAGPSTSLLRRDLSLTRVWRTPPLTRVQQLTYSQQTSHKIHTISNASLRSPQGRCQPLQSLTQSTTLSPP